MLSVVNWLFCTQWLVCVLARPAKLGDVVAVVFSLESKTTTIFITFQSNSYISYLYNILENVTAFSLPAISFVNVTWLNMPHRCWLEKIRQQHWKVKGEALILLFVLTLVSFCPCVAKRWWNISMSHVVPSGHRLTTSLQQHWFLVLNIIVRPGIV